MVVFHSAIRHLTSSVPRQNPHYQWAFWGKALAGQGPQAVVCLFYPKASSDPRSPAWSFSAKTESLCQRVASGPETSPFSVNSELPYHIAIRDSSGPSEGGRCYRTPEILRYRRRRKSPAPPIGGEEGVMPPYPITNLVSRVELEMMGMWEVSWPQILLI
jgi:hypothetical protein